MNSTQQLESRKNGKAKYSPEQLEALDRLYTECSPPNSLQWQQLLQKYPILSNIEPKLITVWFQNRRTSEKQKKKFSALRTANQKLTGMNKLLMEENARLQKHFSILESDNGFLRNRIHTTSVGTNSQHQYNLLPHQRDANNPAVLRAIAVETLAEFRSKVTGTVFKWVPMPSPDSGEFIAVSHYYRGVAARACRFVDLEPHKVAEILKDRLSWYRDCRSVDVHEKISADDNNGGTIELMHMKTYAPTTLPSACDFWTLRYTTVVENDLVICERSLTPSTRGPTGPPTQNFLRAEMLPSGYLIRPCEGGSTIYIVDHIDMDASRVPAVLRPLYESPKFLAQKMTIAALHHVRLIKLKSCHEIPYGGGRQLHVLRILSQRLSRGFNDAINGFADDGWYVKEGFQDVVVAINCSPNKPIGSLSPSSNPSFPTSSGIICAKASILLQNIPPRSMVMYLREHRSVWDYTVKTYSAASLRAGSYAGFLNSQVILPPAHTLEHEEFLEFVKLERHFSQDGVEKPGDFHILQLCSGLDESSLGACAQLVFAPIDESSFSENTPLLPCGFRIISLDSKTENTGSAGRATQAVSDSSDPNLYSNTRSILTIAFQFTYENNLHNSIEMAWKYVRSVVASVNLVAAQIGSRIEPSQFPGASPEDDVVASRCFPNFL